MKTLIIVAFVALLGGCAFIGEYLPIGEFPLDVQHGQADSPDAGDHQGGIAGER